MLHARSTIFTGLPISKTKISPPRERVPAWMALEQGHYTAPAAQDTAETYGGKKGFTASGYLV